MLFGCTHVLTAGLLTQPTTALGQGERADAVMTEIWMGSGGLVLTRQIPQERRSVRGSDEDIARTMVEIAQQRYLEGDQATAIWLAQWARQLTSGRIGSNGFAGFRQHDVDSKVGEVSAADDLPLNRLEDRLVLLPGPLEFHPSGPPASKIAVRPDVIGQPTSPADRGVPQVKVEAALPGGARRPDLLSSSNSFLRSSAPGEQDQQHENQQHQLDQQNDGEFVTAPGKRVQMIDGIGRQVAVVVPESSYISLVSPVDRQSPAESTLEPITIATISFASGTVFCAVLCTLLLLVPVRLTIQRRAESQLPAHDTTLPAEPPAKTAPATTVTRSSHANKPVFKTVGEQDQAKSVVKEFYYHNVALLKQLHDQAIPSVKDAKDNSHHHIGATHG